MVIYVCIKFQENTPNSFQVTEWKAELQFLCSAPCLIMLYICVKFYQNIIFKLTELTQVHGRNDYFQYLLCSKGGNYRSGLTRATVLVFCTSSHCDLHLWEISWKYLKKAFNLQSGHKYMVKMAMFNVQRAVTPKVGKPDLWSMSSAYCLMEL